MPWNGSSGSGLGAMAVEQEAQRGRGIFAVAIHIGRKHELRPGVLHAANRVANTGDEIACNTYKLPSVLTVAVGLSIKFPPPGPKAWNTARGSNTRTGPHRPGARA